MLPRSQNATPPPPPDEVLRAAWLILSRLESGAPTRHPSVSLVVRLYCIEKLTIREVAGRCRCSVGTIVNRLACFEAATGLSAVHFANAGPAVGDDVRSL